jgi:hypothetical protein
LGENVPTELHGPDRAVPAVEGGAMGRFARLLATRRWRRLAVAALLVLGGFLLWGSVAAPSGAVAMLLGLVLEAVGLALEHRDL